jgi:hypothetical protein
MDIIFSVLVSQQNHLAFDYQNGINEQGGTIGKTGLYGDNV